MQRSSHVPQYATIAQEIRARIDSGALKSGDKLESLRIIAKRNNCSHLTVKRAVEGLVADGYLNTAEKRGIFVADRSSRRRSGKNVGVLLMDVPDPTRRNRTETSANGAFSTMLHNLVQYSSGVSIKGCLVHPDGDDDHWTYAPAADVLTPDLSVLIAFRIYDLNYLSTFVGRGANIVAFDVDASDIRVDSAYLDDAGAAFELTHHLISRGHREIVFIGGPETQKPFDHYVNFDPCAFRRAEGYRLAMRTHGLPAHVYHCDRLRFGTELKPLTQRAFKEVPKCTAVLSESGIAPEYIPRSGVEQALWSSIVGAGDTTPHPEFVVAVAECDFMALGNAVVDLVNLRLNDPEAFIQRRVIRPPIRVLKRGRL